MDGPSGSRAEESELAPVESTLVDQPPKHKDDDLPDGPAPRGDEGDGEHHAAEVETGSTSILTQVGLAEMK